MVTVAAYLALWSALPTNIAIAACTLLVCALFRPVPTLCLAVFGTALTVGVMMS